MAPGSTQFVKDLIEADERLAAAPVSSNAKIDAYGDYHPEEHDVEEPPGWLNEHGLIQQDEEEITIQHLEKEPEWDTATQRKMLHFGYSFDRSGGNVTPAWPIPTYLQELQGKL